MLNKRCRTRNRTLTELIRMAMLLAVKESEEGKYDDRRNTERY
jgi:hypothetical protein